MRRAGGVGNGPARKGNSGSHIAPPPSTASGGSSSIVSPDSRAGTPLLHPVQRSGSSKRLWDPLSNLAKSLRKAVSRKIGGSASSRGIEMGTVTDPLASPTPKSNRVAPARAGRTPRQGRRGAAWNAVPDEREFFHAADADLKDHLPWYIILPSDGWKQVWDLGIVLLVLYSAVVIPLNVGFGDPDCSENCSPVSRRQYFDLSEHNLDVLDVVTDIIFGIDILLSFFTAYIHSNGRVEFNLLRIARHYVWPFFVVDLFSVFPFELVIGSNSSQISLTKVLKLPRLVRLSRLWRYFENFRHANLWRVFRLLLIVLMVSHWVLCFFHFIIISAGYPKSTWILEQTNRLDPDFSERYFTVMHAVFLMLYGGDPLPTNEGEQLYSAMMRLLGAVVQAAVFGNVAMLLANQNAASLEWRKEMDQVNQSMRSMDIAPDLQDRIRAYFEYVWQTHGGSSGKKWMWMLTDSLHANVLMHVNQHMISKVKIFRNADPRFVMAIILKFENKLYLPGDYIIVAGTIGKEMYFVAKGVVDIVAEVDGFERPVATLRDGDYFGEIALLSRSRRTASARAKTYVELNMLSREDFDEVCAEFPRDARTLRDVARARLMQLQAAASHRRQASVAGSVATVGGGGEARRSVVEQGTRSMCRCLRMCCTRLCGVVFTNPLSREMERIERLRRQQQRTTRAGASGSDNRNSNPSSRRGSAALYEEKGLRAADGGGGVGGTASAGMPKHTSTRGAFLGAFAASSLQQPAAGRARKLPPLKGAPKLGAGDGGGGDNDDGGDDEAEGKDVTDPLMLLVAPIVRRKLRGWARRRKTELRMAKAGGFGVSAPDAQADGTGDAAPPAATTSTATPSASAAPTLVVTSSPVTPVGRLRVATGGANGTAAPSTPPVVATPVSDASHTEVTLPGTIGGDRSPTHSAVAPAPAKVAPTVMPRVWSGDRAKAPAEAGAGAGTGSCHGTRAGSGQAPGGSFNSPGSTTDVEENPLAASHSKGSDDDDDDNDTDEAADVATPMRAPPAAIPLHGDEEDSDGGGGGGGMLAEELYSPTKLAQIMSGRHLRESRKSLSRDPSPPSGDMERAMSAWVSQLSSSIQQLTETVSALQDRQDRLSAYIMGGGAAGGGGGGGGAAAAAGGRSGDDRRGSSRFNPTTAMTPVQEAPLREAREAGGGGGSGGSRGSRGGGSGIGRGRGGRRYGERSNSTLPQAASLSVLAEHQARLAGAGSQVMAAAAETMPAVEGGSRASGDRSGSHLGFDPEKLMQRLEDPDADVADPFMPGSAASSVVDASAVADVGAGVGADSGSQG